VALPGSWTCNFWGLESWKWEFLDLIRFDSVVCCCGLLLFKYKDGKFFLQSPSLLLFSFSLYSKDGRLFYCLSVCFMILSSYALMWPSYLPHFILSCDEPSLPIKRIEHYISSCRWLFFLVVIFGEQDTTSSEYELITVVNAKKTKHVMPFFYGLFLNPILPRPTFGPTFRGIDLKSPRFNQFWLFQVFSPLYHCVFNAYASL